jgi:hypothetical protein
MPLKTNWAQGDSFAASDANAVATTINANTAAAAAALAAANGKQPLDADLTALAALAPADGDILQRVSGSWLNRTIAQLKTALALVKGDVGLSNVDNTADASKPVSTAQAAADTAVLTAAEAYADSISSPSARGIAYSMTFGS